MDQSTSKPSMAVQLSEAAARKMQSLKMEEGKTADAILRIQVRKGGCSGLSYKMTFEPEPPPKDLVFDQYGQKISVDNESYLYIAGLTLDYSGGLNGKGFIFLNPNASKTCGCGTSFNVKGVQTSSAEKCSTDV